jgi:hypothetical protein
MSGPAGPSVAPAEDIPIQAKIEAVMDACQEGDRWESIVLFSSEGLPMASQGKASATPEGDLLQLAFSLLNTVRLLGEDGSVKEVIIRGDEHRLLSFHFFKAWGEPVILAAVTMRKRGYRRALVKLIHYIQQIQ